MATIEDLCSWKKADTKKTLKGLGLDKLFAKYGIGASAEDLFGEVPETYVHVGDVELAGPMLCDAKGNGIYIIDGSLKVGGAFTYYTADAYTILVVTGALTAKDLCQAWDTQLVVLGDAAIEGVLYVDVSDAGFALFRGAVSSRERYIHIGVESDVPMFAKKPKGKEATEGVRLQEPKDLHAALVRGESIFEQPEPAPKGAKKTPSVAALAKMSVGEVLTVRGFEKMMFDGEKVNPNWFSKGKPGCELASLTIGRAYVDAFPDELGALTELVLLGLEDGKRLGAMLRSLPRLRSLQRLRIANCALAELPVEVATLDRLEAIELDGNKSLTQLPGAAINKLAKLRKLWVTGNSIRTLPDGLDLDRIAEVIFEEKALKLRRQPR